MLFIHTLFTVYKIMLFAKILASWIPEIASLKIMQINAALVDPYLNLFRRFIPPLGVVDISPIFAFLVLGLIERLIYSVFI